MPPCLPIPNLLLGWEEGGLLWSDAVVLEPDGDGGFSALKTYQIPLNVFSVRLEDGIMGSIVQRSNCN
jgi:hypothetical protein